MDLTLSVALILAVVTPKACISPIPGNNSEYEDGKSQYIWMPDGKGTPRLVSLRSPDTSEYMRMLIKNETGANNEYWLYTRTNPKEYQILQYNYTDSVKNSSYKPNQPLIAIVHGWMSDGHSSYNPIIRDAFLTAGDFNVIVVDWSEEASSFNYFGVCENVPNVGKWLGLFLKWLLQVAGGSWDKVHLIGFSLGAHVVGAAGRHVNGLPVRVTGLDPAGPLWNKNQNALDKRSGVYVVHCDPHRQKWFRDLIVHRPCRFLS